MEAIEKANVNESVVRQHRELDSQCKRVLRRLSQACPESALDRWRRELLSDLRILEGRLLTHFRHEERGGFLRDVLREVPNAEGQVATLRREHDQMARELDRIVAALESWERPQAAGVRSLRTKIRTLLEGLERHERAEQHLLQRTYYREYGAGD